MKDDKMKIKWRSVLIVAVLFAIVLFFACAVRMPDLTLLQGRDGNDVWLDESGLPYFLDPDSAYYVRISKEIAETGQYGTSDPKTGQVIDTLQYAPEGTSLKGKNMLPETAAFIWKIMSVFSKVDIQFVDLYFVFFFMLLTIPVAWILTQKAYLAVSGDKKGGAFFAGAVGALLVTCAPAFVSRTLVGIFDTDMVHSFFVLLLMLLMAEIMLQTSLKKGILLAICFGVTALLYKAYWTYSALVFVVLAAAGGGVYVLSRLIMPPSKTNGAALTKPTGRFRQWLGAVPVQIYLAIVVLAGIFVATPFGRPMLTSLLGKVFGYATTDENEISGNNTIVELMAPDFGPEKFYNWFLPDVSDKSTTIVNGVGGLLILIFALASMGYIIFRVAKMRKEGKDTNRVMVYLSVIGTWLIVCFFMTKVGLRMVQFFAFPCAVLVGILAGVLFNKYITNKENISRKKMARNVVLNIAICAAVVLALIGSFLWGREIRSMMSDSLADSMEWVKENAETEDAVVLSWWDYGYYYELESEHPTLWDGGTGTAMRLNIVGRILSTDDPRLCYSLIKMISTSGDKPVDMLTDKLGKAEGFNALYKVVVMDKDDSIRALTDEYGFGGDEAAELEALLHPSEPREVYLVMYETMADQLGVFEYYGNWDYDGENIAPVKTVYTSLPDGSSDMNSTDMEAKEFFEKRTKEMLWRLYISDDTIKKSEVSDSEDDENYADEPAFKKVFEEDDGYVCFMIWKLSW
ncbi:MAG: hypothetical protein IKQ49_06620 [Eubacterium sp.]|nr:hypothetical protein [Eubacterium sp.]